MQKEIVVIGAGAGGLVVAIGAAKGGKEVLLVERGHWGGDCTNFGCVPSKTLIAQAAKQATSVAALSVVRDTVAHIKAHEEPKALNEKGVQTLEGTARFISPHEIAVTAPNGQEERVVGKTFVLATGSSPYIPNIEGLSSTPYLTNETIFSLETVPKSLLVLGGGPIGCELAQAFCRLGCQVTLVHRRENLPK